MKTKSLLLAVYSLLLLAACGTPKGESGVFNIMDYGAVGDGQTDDAAAIQSAINACNKAGGGQVLVPAGHTFLCSPFKLASYVDLHLEANARLLANPDEKVYKESAFRDNRGEGMMWISGKDLEQVSITGMGTIDGNGVAFMGSELEDSYELKPVTNFDPRPHVLTLINVKQLRMRDVTIRNSAYWTVHLIGCHDALIDGISILNNLKIRNGDGIDVDHSRHVRIANCYIESGDDCICLKNRREFEEYGSCEDIVVNNCTMVSRSCAIKIGSENMDVINNVLFNNCIIRDSNRGIGIQNRDEGTVTNVVFSNMIVDCKLWSDVWWGKAEPIYVTSYPRAVGNHKDAGWRFPKGATEGRCGEVSRIWFSNVKCTSENGIFVGGDVPGKVNHIYFNDIDLLLHKRTDYPGGVYDKRPCDGEGFVKDKTYGFYIDTASDITIENSHILWGDTRPDNAAEGVMQKNAQNVVIK
ncbi:glycoside hydrolase family 28 protein [Mediterranea massiliensis]|uniref:glycoside hydrolase family 28 protein n=1 Tax=Mediterranea massiliensis TaxID=1841865 RepID=UPI0025A3399B|nr:glycoside hydrolase family 28 protein [Mediterranea massiliensis]MDM8335867.1 glycoside hydrolase family 28 protein [Mediterranea massiliensis]